MMDVFDNILIVILNYIMKNVLMRKSLAIISCIIKNICFQFYDWYSFWLIHQLTPVLMVFLAFFGNLLMKFEPPTFTIIAFPNFTN